MGTGDEPRWKVFISHTSELRRYPVGRSYIDATERAIIAEGHIPVSMEDFPSTSDPPVDECAKRIKSCDVFIGILGTRYGSLIPGKSGISYTEYEYNTATAAGIPCLMFIMDTNSHDLGIPVSALIDREFGDRQDLLRSKLSGMAQRFSNPDDLRYLVAHSLREAKADKQGNLNHGSSSFRTIILDGLDASSPPVAQGSAAPELKRKHFGRWVMLGLSLLLVTAVGTWAVIDAEPRWQDLPPAPQEFEGAGVAQYDGKLWIAGGASTAPGIPGVGRPHLDTVFTYDPTTKEWQSGPALPAPIAFGPLVATDKGLYLIGGQERDSSGNGGPVTTVLRLDEESASWVAETALPEARARGAAVWDGERVVYAGGVDAGLAVSDAIYALKDGQWKQIGQLGQAREKLAVATNGFGRVWFMGGRNKQTDMSAFRMVDVVRDTGEISVEELAHPVHSAAGMWRAGTGPCVVGGDTGTGVTDRIECLEGDSAIPPMPQPLAGLGADFLQDELHVVGGYGDTTNGTNTFRVLQMNFE